MDSPDQLVPILCAPKLSPSQILLYLPVVLHCVPWFIHQCHCRRYLLMSTMLVSTSTQSSINAPHPPPENRLGTLFVDDVLCPDEMKELHGKMFPVKKKSRSKKKPPPEPIVTLPIDISSISRGKYDLCQHISPGAKKASEKFDQFHFCPLVYSIEGGFDGDGYKKLSRTLISSAEFSSKAVSVIGNGKL